MKPSHRFRNAHPHAPHTLGGLLRWKLGLARESASVLFPGAPEPRDEAKGRLTSVTCPLASHEVRLTWIGHSTFLVQHQGLNILTDPIFGDCQPIPLGGMRRAQSPVPSIENLPAIDFVFISHSHYWTYRPFELWAVRFSSGCQQDSPNGLPSGNSVLVMSWVGGNLRSSHMGSHSIVFPRSMDPGGTSLIVIERSGVAGS